MISRNQIKFIRSLEQKKFREEHGLFVAEGKKIVYEILHSSLEIHSLYYTPGFKLPHSKGKEFRKFEVETNELEKISFLSAPNEVLCVVKRPTVKTEIPKIKNELSLLLEDIRDPGNMGSILRIADWFGIHQVVCSQECVDVYNPKVVQSSMGSIARINIFYCDAFQLINDIKKEPTGNDFEIYAAVLDGKNIYYEALTQRGLIILGNESTGISSKLMSQATRKITIPSSGKAESLNVAASAAVLCSEFRRRQ